MIQIKDEAAEVYCETHSNIAIPFRLRSFINCAMKSRQLALELIQSLVFNNHFEELKTKLFEVDLNLTDH